jgi:hypothetical protein
MLEVKLSISLPKSSSAARRSLEVDDDDDDLPFIATLAI